MDEILNSLHSSAFMCHNGIDQGIMGLIVSLNMDNHLSCQEQKSHLILGLKVEYLVVASKRIYLGQTPDIP